MGYVGITLVAALLPESITPEVLVQIATRTRMQVIICGFNPGNGPDPFEEPELVKERLRHAGKYTVALAYAKMGPNLMVGPTHTWHGQKRTKWDEEKFMVWMRHLDNLAEELRIDFACEPLNEIEDGTPDAFNTVKKAVTELVHVGIHADTRHIHMRYGQAWEQVLGAAVMKIWYFELVNARRLPCDKPAGVDFLAYSNFILFRLNDRCFVGVEPFAKSVVVKFGFTNICQQRVSGIECLRRDMKYFVEFGIFERAV